LSLSPTSACLGGTTRGGVVRPQAHSSPRPQPLGGGGYLCHSRRSCSSHPPTHSQCCPRPWKPASRRTSCAAEGAGRGHKRQPHGCSRGGRQGAQEAASWVQPRGQAGGTRGSLMGAAEGAGRGHKRQPDGWLTHRRHLQLALNAQALVQPLLPAGGGGGAA